MTAKGIGPESVDARVRRRVRELRRQQGLTLAAVASRAALDVSMLSRLESGKRRLPLDHLPVLAAAVVAVARRRRAEPEVSPGYGADLPVVNRL